jgi:hypothetical protein
MRKLHKGILLVVLFIWAGSWSGTGHMVYAQGENRMNLDEWYLLELDSSNFAQEFVLSGTAGDLILLEGHQNTPDLELIIELYTANGTMLATTDTFGLPNAALVYILPETGDYTVRYVLDEGEGEAFALASLPDPLERGEGFYAPLINVENDLPDYMVIALQEGGTYTLKLSGLDSPYPPAGFRFESFFRDPAVEADFGDPRLISLQLTAHELQVVKEANYTLNLSAEMVYLITIDKTQVDSDAPQDETEYPFYVWLD